MSDPLHEALPRLLLVAHLDATVFMTGLIWFVQVVHYPLFARVAFARARGRSHSSRFS